MHQGPLKKICFVVSDPITVNAFMELHFKYLSSLFQVHLVANLNQGAILNTNHICSIKHIPINRAIHPFKDIMAFFALWKHFKTMQFDAVHSITPKAGLLGMLASKLAGTANRTHIFTGQIWHTQVGISKWLFKQIDRFLVLLSTHLLVDSHAQRDFLIAEKVLTKNNSKVLGKGSISGVSATKFAANEAKRLLYRNKYQITAKDLVYAFLGRLNQDKGINELITAFIQFNQYYPNTKLLLIGPDEENIYERINSHLKHQIIFIGYTKCPEDYLQIADVFCMPSHREGFGTSVIEASMLGIPVICSDTYGLRDAFIANETGLQHQVGNIDSLQQCLEKIYLDPKLRMGYGANAHNYAKSNFEAATVSEHWLNFYTHLLIHNNQPAI